MPSKSKKQHNLMAMVAHDKKAAKRLGISQKVGKEFVKADKGKKFAEGGKVTGQELYDAAMKMNKEDWDPMAAIKRVMGGKPEVKKSGKAISITRETVTASPEAVPEEIKDKLQTIKNEKAYKDYEKRRAAGEDYKKGGAVKAKCMARGGGCEVRGKTRGRFV